MLVALLDFAPFEGRDDLRAQIDAALVTGGCGCGCASVDLEVADWAPHAVVREPVVPNRASVLDEQGEPIGGVLIALRDGRLAVLEVYTFGDKPIAAMPPLARLEFDHGVW